MSKEDAKCYSKRYFDLNGSDPVKHYLMIGKEQGRNPYCAQNLTGWQAKRYLSRYPDLNKKFGTNGKAALQFAKEHYKNIGYFEKRDISRYHYEEPILIGNSPNLKINNCNGRVYMGLTFRPDNNQLITSFDELLQWKTVHKLTKG